MIKYSGFRLNNGLQVFVHEDHSTPMAVVNITYNVGSKDEHEDLTGFAHLFEHLMFGGSEHIESFDAPIQEVGGECNAFTSSDITNYYITLPSSNLETAFWLESDRMFGLSINAKTLEVQQKVVIEEYKQRYINQPYGDLWLKTLPLAYQSHPYRWATIGRDISHIENASLEDVRAFYRQYYCPANAVMVVAGDVTVPEVRALTEKWFGDINGGSPNLRTLPQEPRQSSPRFESFEADVPLNALVKAYHMPGRFQEGFFEADLLSDILGRGKSSRLYQKLVKETRLFNRLSAQITSTLDPGLLIIKGFLNPGIELKAADTAVEEIVCSIAENGAEDEEVARVKNQSEATLEFSEVELLNRAMNLAYATTAGNSEWANQDIHRMKKVTAENIKDAARDILRPDNCSTMYYLSNPRGNNS